MATKLETFALPLSIAVISLVSVFGGAYLAGYFQIQGTRAQIAFENQKVHLDEARAEQKLFVDLAANYIVSVDRLINMIAKGDSRIRASDVGKGLDDLEVNKAKLEIMSDDDILIATDNLFTKVVNLLSERGKKDYAPVAQLRTKWLFIVRDHVKKQFNLLANPVEP